ADTGRLIQYQHSRVMVERSGDADTLTLPSGEANTAFTYDRLQPVRKRGNEFLELRRSDRAAHRNLVNLFTGQTEGHIAPERVVSQVHCLRYIADLILPGAEVALNVLPIHPHLPCVRGEQPQNDID